MATGAQLHRAFPATGRECRIRIDGREVLAQTGQSVLSVLLEQGRWLRRHEQGGEPRAGFCLMGACQDCWVWLSPDQRGRACTTPVAPGMQVFTATPTSTERQP